jgi:hypothetical protein
MISKKAQGWGLDAILASMIFMSAVLIFYVYIINNSNQSEETFNSMNYDANIIGDMLVSEGLPNDWTESNVTAIGIASESEINDTKLERFYALSLQDYSRTASIFQTRFSYFINFSQPMAINGQQINGIGRNISSPSNLIKVSRFTIYKKKPTTINIYIFQ